MGRRNGYLDRLAVQQAVRDRDTRQFTLQQAQDMALITLHERFGWGPERIRRFAAAYGEVFTEYADMVLQEDRDDREHRNRTMPLAYSKEKTDDALRRACGEYFVPWEQRYGG